MKKQYISPEIYCHRLNEGFSILAASDNNTDQQIGANDPTDVTGGIGVGTETEEDEGAL